MKSSLSTTRFVDPSYNMQYYGTILDLDSFPGHVLLYGNTFTSNVLQYSSCNLATTMDSSTNSGTDNYSIYGTKSVMQIRSLISVVDHWLKFEMLGNTFTGNSGTKGIVYLDMKPRTYFPVVIGGNTFTKNAGYIDANVIMIRARGASA